MILKRRTTLTTLDGSRVVRPMARNGDTVQLGAFTAVLSYHGRLRWNSGERLNPASIEFCSAVIADPYGVSAFSHPLLRHGTYPKLTNAELMKGSTSAASDDT